MFAFEMASSKETFLLTSQLTNINSLYTLQLKNKLQMFW